VTDIVWNSESSPATTEETAASPDFWYRPDDDPGEQAEADGAGSETDDEVIGMDGGTLLADHEPEPAADDAHTVPPVEGLDGTVDGQPEPKRTEDGHLVREVPDVTPAQSPLKAATEHDPDRWLEIEAEMSGRPVPGPHEDKVRSGSRTKYILIAVVMVIAAVALMYFLTFGMSSSSSTEPGVRHPDTAGVSGP
jgi:hypothetical protein